MRHRLIPIIYVLFAISGFTGLIYESLWARYMKLLLGHSSYGQIMTLVIFMGGLGLGAFLGGKYARILKSPFLLYALIEVLIGIGGLSYHYLFSMMNLNLFQFLGHTTLQSESIFLLKIAAAILLTLPWAILLGMTFPCLSIGVMEINQDSGRRSLSWLYFTNSLGGALGILSASFLLIPQFGTAGSLKLAGILNLILGLCFYLVSQAKASEVMPSKMPQAPPMDLPEYLTEKRVLILLLLLSGITGLSSFLYEIGWIRLLSLILGSSTHSFDIMVSAFILGLASGSLCSRFIMQTRQNPLFLLGLIQIAMGCFAALSLVSYEQIFALMNQSHAVLQHSPEAYSVYSAFKYLLCTLLMFPTSFCAGITLPLITWSLLRISRKEQHIGNVYASNTLGSILGAVCGGLLLLPLLQLKGMLLLGAIFDIVLGLVLFVLLKTSVWKTSVYATISAFIFTLVLLTPINTFTLSSGLFRESTNLKQQTQDQLIKPRIKHGRTATISFHDYGNRKVLKTNGKPDASVEINPKDFTFNDEITQLALAAYPMNLQKKPYQAAMIGMGSGMAAHFLLADDLLINLDLIEIEPEVYELAKGFNPINERVYNSPKIKLHFEDARTFFYSQNKKYDLIISEPSNPWVSGVSGLFTHEFYHDMQNFLNPQGLLVQWVQSYEFNSELLLSILTALNQEFDYVSVYGLPAKMQDQILPSNLIILASNQVINMPFASDIRVIPKFSKDLQRLALTPQRFSATQRITTHQTLASLLESRTANSDYLPIIDNLAEFSMYTNESVDLYDFLLFSAVSYQSLFEPDYSELLQKRLTLGHKDQLQLLEKLSYHLKAPLAIQNHEIIQRDFNYLVKRFLPVLDFEHPVLKEYQSYIFEHRLLTQALELDLLKAYKNGSSGKGLKTLQLLLKQPAPEVSNHLIRIMSFYALKEKHLLIYRQILKYYIVPNPGFSLEEKELLQTFLPEAKTSNMF